VVVTAFGIVGLTSGRPEPEPVWLGLGSVVETGARYLLDPRAKHEPTFVSADPAGRTRRVAFLKRLSRQFDFSAESAFWTSACPHGATITREPIISPL